MPTSREQLLTLVTAVSVFALILALWVGVLLLWSLRRAAKERKLGRRLGWEEEAAQPKVLRLWHETGSATTLVPGQTRVPLWFKLERIRRDAGFETDLRALLTMLLGATLGGGVAAAALFQNVLLGLAVAATVPTIFWLYIKARTNKRAALFENQFVSALDLASRSLRAGHPLLGAFQLVSDELEPPVRDVFGEICQQHDMGVSLEAAIQRVAQGSRSSELKVFATSVAVQLRSGGNLAEMMERLAAVIRDRARLSRRVRVLTAQTQISKRILLAMPFLVFSAIHLIRPQYTETFYTTDAGPYLLALAGGMMLMGVIVMNRMSVLKY